MAQVKKSIKPSITDEEIKITSVSEDNGVELEENKEIKVQELLEIPEVTEQDNDDSKQIEEFQKVGILKAQSGTTGDFWAEIEEKKKKAEELRNSGFVMAFRNPVVEEEIINEPLDEALYKGRQEAISKIYSENDPEKQAALARLNAEYGKKDNKETPIQTTKNKLGLPFYLRETTNLANWIAARKTAKDLKTIGYKTADVMGRMTLNAPIITTNNRFISPNNNQYDVLGSKLLTNINQLTNADSGQTIAAKLAGYQQWGDLMKEKIHKMSADFYDWQIRNAEDWKQQQIYNTDTSNKNRQIMTQSALARLNADSAYKQEKRKLDDTLLYKYQDLLNRFGSVDASIKNKTYQYAEQELAARAAGNEVLAQQYSKLKEDTQKPGYRNYMLNNILYGKKGTKLRSTTDMSLLNNQKLVARAIEKLNDNTMKLILKALS